MGIGVNAAAAVPPATLAALNQAAQAGLEFASAAAGLGAALMGNQMAAANQLPPAPQPAAPAAAGCAARGPQVAGLGGILQQLMQLLQKLAPMLQQLSGGAAQCNGAAANLASQMPASGALTACAPLAGADPPWRGGVMGVTTHEQGVAWARSIRPDASAADLNQGARLAGIFSGGVAL
jgi:hypothetical protein